MTDSAKAATPLARFFDAAAKIRPNELNATLLSAAFVFVLMAAYFMLRPVRDAMASDWSDAEVSYLWNLNFFISLAAVVLYGYVASRVRFRWLVPGVYVFFAASFLVFYSGSSWISDPTLVDKSFYVWLSVFALFHLSVFWSFMSNLFSREQAPRLFGFIAIGASTGAIAGPLIAASTAGIFTGKELMLVSAFMLFIPVPIILALERLKVTALGNADLEHDPRKDALGRNPFAGFVLFFKSPYLLGIAAFILLYVAIGSFVYFQQKNLLEDFSRVERRELLAWVDFTVNTLAVLTAMFLTSRLTTRLGMARTLAIVPVFVCVALLALAVSPILIVVLGLQVMRRAGNYAITRPGREMLFTAVGREARFKAKPVIDIVLYRGGDALWGSAFATLTGFGLGLGAVAAVGAVIAAVWAAVGFVLGRTFDGLSREDKARLNELGSASHVD
ncbi:MAG: MFS transporter [Pseudomonadota bacterium]